MAGQELLHSYGDLSDAELLSIFGFVDTMGVNFTNPHNKACSSGTLCQFRALRRSGTGPPVAASIEMLLLKNAVRNIHKCFLSQNSLSFLLQVHLPTETLVALCQEQKSGRRLGKNFKRRKDFLKDVDMLPEGFPISIQDPIPDSLVTVTQVRSTAPGHESVSSCHSDSVSLQSGSFFAHTCWCVTADFASVRSE